MYVDPGRRRRRHRHGLLSLAAPSATISRQIRQVKTAIEHPKMLMVGYSFSPSNRTCGFLPGAAPTAANTKPIGSLSQLCMLEVLQSSLCTGFLCFAHTSGGSAGTG